MSINPFWGQMIKSLRTEQSVSQRVLASRAKVNRNTLRRIEAGQTSVEIDTMERMLDYLGYELEAMTKASVTDRLRQQSSVETNPDRQNKLAVARLLSFTL